MTMYKCVESALFTVNLLKNILLIDVHTNGTCLCRNQLPFAKSVHGGLEALELTLPTFCVYCVTAVDFKQ